MRGAEADSTAILAFSAARVTRSGLPLHGKRLLLVYHTSLVDTPSSSLGFRTKAEGCGVLLRSPFHVTPVHVLCECRAVPSGICFGFAQYYEYRSVNLSKAIYDLPSVFFFLPRPCVFNPMP